jgi:hypothetical protein
MNASDLSFVETIVRSDGRPGRKGHYYAWARCGTCGEPQLVRRAGLAKRRCVMTPKCRGLLVPAEVEDVGAVDLAVAAFGAVVVEDVAS